MIRTDIVYDCGTQLNPCVDIGQIEGSFVMGLGFFFTEEVVINDEGRMVNNGTWDYKPPSSKDIPIQFNVSLLGSGNANSADHNVLGSKATGEPPYQLSASAFFAMKDCIYAARADNGLTGYFQLDTPATVDQIQQSCGITIQALNLNPTLPK